MSFIELEIFTCDFETRLPWQFHAMPGEWSKDLWQWSQSVEFLCRHTCDTLVEPTTQGAQCRATPYSWLYDCRAPPRRGMIAWDMYGPLTWAWLTGSATRAFRFELLQHFPGSLWDPGHFNFDIVVLFFVGSAQESILNGTEAWHNPCGKPCIVQLYNPSLPQANSSDNTKVGATWDVCYWCYFVNFVYHETDVTGHIWFLQWNSVQMQALVVEKWSLLAWGLAEFGFRCEEKSGTKLDFGFCQFPPVFSGCHWGGVGNASSRVGSNALSYFSCEGIGGLTFVLAFRHILWYEVLKDVGKSKRNQQYHGFSVILCHLYDFDFPCQVSLQALCRPCAAWQNCSTGWLDVIHWNPPPSHVACVACVACVAWLGCGWCFCFLCCFFPSIFICVGGRWNGGSSRWFGLSVPGSSDSLQRYRSQCCSFCCFCFSIFHFCHFFHLFVRKIWKAIADYACRSNHKFLRWCFVTAFEPLCREPLALWQSWKPVAISSSRC